MAFSQTHSVHATGFQFDSITGNGVTINLSEQLFGLVRLIDDPLGARVFSPWGVNIFSDTGTSLSPQDVLLRTALHENLNPADPKLFDFNVDCIADLVNESLVLTPSIQMGPNHQSTKCFHYCSLSFRIQLPGNADPDKALVLIPGAVETVVPFNDAQEIPIVSEAKLMHPGHAEKGGPGVGAPVPGIVSYDEPSGEINPTRGVNSQYIYLYDYDTNEGVMIRTNDNIGRNKVFALQRVGDELLVTVRFIPKDNSIGVDGQSDETPFSYGVEIRPMVGDFNDATEYDAQRKDAEGHPGFASQTWNQPGSNRSRRAKHAVCFSPVWSGGLGQDFEKFIEQNRRIRNYFKGSLWSIITLWYGTEPADLNQFSPRHIPFNSNAAQKIKEAAAEHQTVMMYVLPIQADVETFDELALGIENNHIRTRTGYIYAAEPTLDASEKPFTVQHVTQPGRLKYVTFSWTDEANNREYVKYITDQFKGLGATGYYLDAGGWQGSSCNDDPNANPEDRGCGTTTFGPGVRSLPRLFKEEHDERDTVIMQEWPCDMFMGDIDVVSWQSVGPHGLDSTQIWGPVRQFSERVRGTTFHTFGQGANNELDVLNQPGIVSKLEWLNGVYAYWHSGGHLMPVGNFFFLRDEYFIAHPGEADFDAWFEAAIPHYQFLAKLWFRNEYLVNRFHTSKRLFETPKTSIVRRKIEERLGVPVTQSNYLYGDAWYDRELDTIGISCKNWTLSAADGGEIGATETWDETFTTALFPDLGNAPRDVWLVDEDHSVTQLAGYDGGGSYTVPNIQMTPGRVVWLVIGQLVLPETEYVELKGESEPIVELKGTGIGMTQKNELMSMKNSEKKTVRCIVLNKDGSIPDLRTASDIRFSLSKEPNSDVLLRRHFDEIQVTESAPGAWNRIECPIFPTHLVGVPVGKLYMELFYIIAGVENVTMDGTFILEESNSD